MQSIFLLLGALSALTGVGFGAFGAHVLKASLSPEMLAVYQTGVNYHMWHALGLIGIALAQQHAPDSKQLQWAGGLMFLGIVMFSGSLYGLSVLGQEWLGIITPVGGVSFIIAWGLLASSSLKRKPHSRYKNL